VAGIAIDAGRNEPGVFLDPRIRLTSCFAVRQAGALEVTTMNASRVPRRIEARGIAYNNRSVSGKP